jgi:hypothetical protein
MTVAAHAQTFIHETVIAGVGCLGGDDTLGHEGQGLGGLEGGARGVLSHDGTIDQGLPGIQTEFAVALGALASYHHTGVVAGGADHAEHLASLGLKGYDGTDLAFQQAFAQGLQVEVDAKGKVLAWHGWTVEFTILITALDTSVGIAQQYLHAFLAAQVLLVIAFYTEFTDIVARLIIVVFFDIRGGYFGYVAQHMSGIGVFVLADAAFLNIETGETVHLLLQHTEIVVGELTPEHLFCETGVTGVLRTIFDGLHTFVELLAGDAQGFAEFKGVEVVLGFIHHHHDIVRGLVIDQQLAVAVFDDAS